MKKFLTIIGVCLLFVTLSLSGCEILEEKENYITVNVSPTISIALYESQGKEISVWDKVAIGVPVHIEIIKDGGERLTFDEVTNAYGWVNVVGSFNLYKEQRIEVTAETRGGFEDFYEYKSGFAMLLWDTVDATADFGGTYAWHPTVPIEMRNTNSTY